MLIKSYSMVFCDLIYKANESVITLVFFIAK